MANNQNSSEAVAEVGAKVVKFDDLVEIVGAKKAKQLKPGVRKTVHRILAEKLVKKGEAEYIKK